MNGRPEMHPILRKGLAGLALLLAACLGAPAQEAVESKAGQAILIDGETGAVLFAKDADAPVQPASLAKLMTVELAFKALRDGEATLGQPFSISESATAATKAGAVNMALNPGQSVRLEDLVLGITVHSANDACIALAEGLAGGEQPFVDRMNARARDLGLFKSAFANATGLPAPGQQVTMREIAMLGRHIWQTYPEYYGYYALPEFTLGKNTFRNRNPLLRMKIGADGMQTGLSEASGYTLLGAAAQGDRRLFLAVSGLATEAERSAEAKRLIDWGMSSFTRREAFAAGGIIGEAVVYGGMHATVPLAAEKAVTLLAPVADPGRISGRIVYEGPLAAPIAKGQRVGVLRIAIGDMPSLDVPLHAAADVPLGPLTSRAYDAIGELLTGWLR